MVEIPAKRIILFRLGLESMENKNELTKVPQLFSTAKLHEHYSLPERKAPSKMIDVTFF